MLILVRCSACRRTLHEAKAAPVPVQTYELDVHPHDCKPVELKADARDSAYPSGVH